jgi:glycine cleavage system aminomethyltransferase T
VDGCAWGALDFSVAMKMSLRGPGPEELLTSCGTASLSNVLMVT